MGSKLAILDFENIGLSVALRRYIKITIGGCEGLHISTKPPGHQLVPTMSSRTGVELISIVVILDVKFERGDVDE